MPQTIDPAQTDEIASVVRRETPEVKVAHVVSINGTGISREFTGEDAEKHAASWAKGVRAFAAKHGREVLRDLEGVL